MTYIITLVHAGICGESYVNPIQSDMAGACQGFGFVAGIESLTGQDPGAAGSGAFRMQFADVEGRPAALSARECIRNMHGRWYDERQLVVEYDDAHAQERGGDCFEQEEEEDDVCCSAHLRGKINRARIILHNVISAADATKAQAQAQDQTIAVAGRNGGRGRGSSSGGDSSQYTVVSVPDTEAEFRAECAGAGTIVGVVSVLGGVPHSNPEAQVK